MSDTNALPGVEELPDDPEVPIADALDQARAATDDPGETIGRRADRRTDDIEVPDVDAWEQSQATHALDDDY